MEVLICRTMEGKGSDSANDTTLNTSQTKYSRMISGCSHLQLVFPSHRTGVLCSKQAVAAVFHGAADGFGSREPSSVARAYPAGRGCDQAANHGGRI